MVVVVVIVIVVIVVFVFAAVVTRKATGQRLSLRSRSASYAAGDVSATPVSSSAR